MTHRVDFVENSQRQSLIEGLMETALKAQQAALMAVESGAPIDEAVSLACRNWTQAALAASQAYKTLTAPEKCR